MNIGIQFTTSDILKKIQRKAYDTLYIECKGHMAKLSS